MEKYRLRTDLSKIPGICEVSNSKGGYLVINPNGEDIIQMRKFMNILNRGEQTKTPKIATDNERK